MKSTGARGTAGTGGHAELLRRRAEETLRDVSPALGEGSAAGALARGKMFELVGYFSEAVAAYSDALALDAGLSEARARRALSQLKARQVGEALESARDLAARQPDYIVQALTTDEEVSAMTILGDALLANDRLEEAKTAYEEARAISAEDSYAAARLAQIDLINNDPEKALERRAAFESNPRFMGLAATFNLADSNIALLPRVSRGSLVANLERQVPGRPVVVGGEIRLAEVREGDDSWCQP